MSSVRFSSADHSHRTEDSYASSRLEQQWVPATLHSLPEIVKCTKCAGQGSKGFFVCKSHCHVCAGTGEGSKKQLLKLLDNMRLGDVDAAVVLHAVSTEKRDDKSIVLAAVGRFPKAIQFASERLKANQEVIDTAATAESALKKSSSAKMLSLSASHISTGATGLTSYRLSELREAASEWDSFSHEAEA